MCIYIYVYIFPPAYEVALFVVCLSLAGELLPPHRSMLHTPQCEHLVSRLEDRSRNYQLSTVCSLTSEAGLLQWVMGFWTGF